MIELIEKPFSSLDMLSLMGNTTENIKAIIPTELMDLLPIYGEARTWWYGDIIAGCGGIVIYEPGKCEAWSIINKSVSIKLKRQLLVGSRKFLEESATKHDIKYMKATWRTDFDKNIRWLEHLGFKNTNETATINSLGDKAYIYERLF
jgi:hypothetical protein